jgi:hypothetical protein
MNKLFTAKDCFDTEKFGENEIFNKTLTHKIDQQKTYWRKSLNSTA